MRDLKLGLQKTVKKKKQGFVGKALVFGNPLKKGDLISHFNSKDRIKAKEER